MEVSIPEPSPNGANGRNAGGQFAPGNPGGPGNPRAKRVAAIRSALFDAVTDEDVRTVVAKLVDMARGGDLPAIRELLDRLLGKPLSPVLAAIEMNVNEDGTASGGQTMSEVRHALLHEPEFVEYLRQKALGNLPLECYSGAEREAVAEARKQRLKAIELRLGLRSQGDSSAEPMS